MFRQEKAGKRALSAGHQIPARPKALFHIRREHGKEILSGEDEAKR